jgi:hypothetical protein
VFTIVAGIGPATNKLLKQQAEVNLLIVVVIAVTVWMMGCERSPEKPAESIPSVSPTGNVTDHQDGESTVSGARADELHDVFEVVFRYQFENNASGLQQDAPAYFLSINKEDPDEAFLNRFSGNKPPVRKGSEFAVGDGVKFYIRSWKWASIDLVEIAGGYYEGGVSASGNRFIVVRKEGRWFVDKDTMDWIS